MREDTILSLETTARYRPENPYQPARQWGWRQAPSSHLAEAILRSTDWHQSTVKTLLVGKSLAVGTQQLFSKIEGQSQHRSRNNLQLAAPALFAVCTARIAGR